MSTTYQELVPWPAPAVGEGKSFGRVSTLASVLAPQESDPRVEFREVTTPGLTRLNVGASRFKPDPRIWRLLAPEGTSPSVVAGGDTGAEAVQVSAGGAVLVDLKRTSWIVLEFPTGRLRVESGSNGVGLQSTPSVEIERLKLSVPPLDRWCEPLGDRWLQNEVQIRLAVANDPWGVASAAGMVATLADMPALRPGPSATAALDARRPLLDADRHLREWARQWSDAERATVNDLAFVGIEQLDARVSALAAHIDASGQPSDAWRSELVDICHLRDDLDGMVVLSGWAGGDRAIADAVASIDHRVEPFMRLLCLDAPVDDERLRRVWLGQPDAWWGWPAAPDDDAEEE